MGYQINMRENMNLAFHPARHRCKCSCFFVSTPPPPPPPPTPTPTPTPTPPTPTNEEAFNGWRHTDQYIFVSTGVLSYSIDIQFFSRN